MHPNPAFRGVDQDNSLSFARERGFGLLTINSDPVPLVSHIPFVLSQDGQHAELHLVRSNPMARAVKAPVAARLAVSGPDGYISPDWYGLEDQVPTWNYVAVHLTGTLHPLPDDDLPAVLDRVSAQFEEQLLPKPPWTRSKMDPGVQARMMRMIRPFRLMIDDVQSTWKLGQNKPQSARLAAATHVNGHNIGSEARVLAGLMQSPIAEPNKD